MQKSEIVQSIKSKKSFLCVGLDTDPSRLPAHFNDFANPVLEFNKQIIDGTKDFCVAFKNNTAFYEALGDKGWETLHRTVEYIPDGIFTIADAKRGDIGNTTNMYAKAFFETMNFDAVTLAPYMGRDSVEPFLAYPDKWAIVLGLTSNASSKDVQFQKVGNSYLFEKTIEQIKEWGTPENTMIVAGATHPKMFEKIRAIVPDHFLLVPGIGSQGGDLAQIAHYGFNDDVGILANVSRGIIYAGSGGDYLVKATEAAQQYQHDMVSLLNVEQATT